jgi:hypothetical protein
MEVLNFPMFASGGAMSPLVTAVHNQNYCMLAVLLAHGAKVVTPQEEIDRAAGARLAIFSGVERHGLILFPQGTAGRIIMITHGPIRNIIQWRQHLLYRMTLLR